MKKKLEADLITIAHRILKLKNKSELIQLHLETQRLYEKLSVLCFVEKHFGEVKPTIGLQAMEEKIEEIFDVVDKKEIFFIQEEPKENAIKSIVIDELKEDELEKSTIKETVIVEDLKVEEEKKETSDNNKEVSKEEIVIKEVCFKPSFQFVTPLEEEKKQVTLEDLLESVQPDPIFVRAEEVKKEENNNKAEVKKGVIAEIDTEKPSKAITLNDRLKKGINFGLNDRIAFQKHLFGNSGEDLNRVISQLNTFDKYEDARNFIEEIVRPDYSNWEGKEDYITRFMEIVENKFI